MALPEDLYTGASAGEEYPEAASACPPLPPRSLCASRQRPMAKVKKKHKSSMLVWNTVCFTCFLISFKQSFVLKKKLF
jgi:hypothetical protein